VPSRFMCSSRCMHTNMDCVDKELECDEGRQVCPQFDCVLNCDNADTSCEEGYAWATSSDGVTCGACIALSCEVDPCPIGSLCRDKEVECPEGSVCGQYECYVEVVEEQLCLYGDGQAVSVGATLLMDDGCQDCRCTESSVPELECFDLGCTTETPTTTTTETPTDTPTDPPTDPPTDSPTTEAPTTTETPTDTPTDTPTESPTDTPTESPTDTPWWIAAPHGTWMWVTVRPDAPTVPGSVDTSSGADASQASESSSTAAILGAVVACVVIIVGFLVWKKHQDRDIDRFRRRSSFRGHRADFSVAIENTAYEVPSSGVQPVTYSDLSGSDSITFTSGQTPATPH